MYTIVIIVLAIACAVAGHLLLKVGVQGLGLADAWPLSLVSWRSVAGAASFGMGLLLYATVLQRLPLNVAQSIFAAQFVAVILASGLVLGEPISLARWLGIILIASGIALVGWTTEWT